jgi:glycine amidinotransferase
MSLNDNTLLVESQHIHTKPPHMEVMLKEYFRAGARWTSAPKPELRKELFDYEYRIPEEGDPIVYVLTEWEPVFDAADFMRCGRDLFVQKSNVTNAMGIEWLSVR